MRKLRSAASGVLQAPLPTRQTPSPWRRPPLAHHSLSGHPPLPVRPPSASPPSRHACRTPTTPPGLSRSRHVLSLALPYTHSVLTYSSSPTPSRRICRSSSSAALTRGQRTPRRSVKRPPLGKRVLSSMKARRSRPPSSFPPSRLSSHQRHPTLSSTTPFPTPTSSSHRLPAPSPSTPPRRTRRIATPNAPSAHLAGASEGVQYVVGRD